MTLLLRRQGDSGSACFALLRRKAGSVHYTFLDILFPVALFLVVIAALMSGYHVAFSLAGVSLAFAFLGALTGHFDLPLLGALPARLFGIMNNDTLIAIPLFVLMGVLLEKSRIAEELLETMALLFGGLRGGLAIAICLVGALLAASTGIVGATVVAMGLISLPAMLRYRYQPELAAGIVAASGTLGQIIPPSIVLIILGDQISSAYQQAQLSMGNYSARTVTVGDLFLGSLAPGILLVIFYILFVGWKAWRHPESAPAVPLAERQAVEPGELRQKIIHALAPPLLLILGVLGSIIAGVATATEAASVGVMGAIALSAVRRQMDLSRLRSSLEGALRITAMVFMILIGASLFSLVFRGFEGDLMVETALSALPGGRWAALATVMLVIFLMGFFLDFFEIVFIVIPIAGPILLAMGFDPIWLGVLVALNLQTSFLTPPFGFALFYLRGVAPPELKTVHIYRGVVPFIGLQLIALLITVVAPSLATWLPRLIYGE
ncbi:MAG: TRAP transporter large permease subunit [Leptospirales bacterium]|nr:TRAP transporter large permease subunit [Leptospirales bacterium]